MQDLIPWESAAHVFQAFRTGTKNKCLVNDVDRTNRETLFMWTRKIEEKSNQSSGQARKEGEAWEKGGCGTIFNVQSTAKDNDQKIVIKN